MKTDEPVGFVGLGSMGAVLAANLASSGLRLVVHDSRREAYQALSEFDVVSVETPQEVASLCETVFVCLPTPAVVREVALGEGGLVHGSAIRTYVDMSTTGPSMAKAVAEKLGARGIQCVDAPVSGGVGGARARSLVLMVSGKPEVVAGLGVFFDALGKQSIVGTEVGQGQSMKLINNLMAAAHLALAAEATTLGVKAGLRPEIILDTLNAGSGRNSATADRFPQHVLPRTFNNGFSNFLMRKDVRLCLEMAEDLQVPLWVGTAVDRLWMHTVLQVGPDEGSTSIVKLVEQWAGVQVAGSSLSA
ncbi:NAD(P)-dependent oxidoreductase [Alcaligenaceae bacterium]|nr:NAD(P)-dependent oxidoreductase [Alcaligenaceae bacterium]